MSGGELLILGKALMWWGIPFAIGVVSLVRLRREIRRDRERSEPK